jgi:hypothetical protein
MVLKNVLSFNYSPGSYITFSSIIKKKNSLYRKFNSQAILSYIIWEKVIFVLSDTTKYEVQFLAFIEAPDCEPSTLFYFALSS